jgi:hypothetical protein
LWVKAVDELLKMIMLKQWITKEQLLEDRPDADQVHSEGFFFFNIHLHRTLILVDLGNEVIIIWAGTHQKYESVFKNNKKVVAKWLRKNEWIY